MQLDRSRFVATVDLQAVRAALSEWSWLLRREDAWEPVLVSVSGDVFMAHDSGEVFWLDTGAGKVSRICASVAEFEASLEDRKTASDWLLVPVVEELLSSGRSLAPGQCFGFTILPVFKEGSYAARNRFALSALEHVRVTGDLHNQIQGLEDGQQVRLSVVE